MLIGEIRLSKKLGKFALKIISCKPVVSIERPEKALV